MPCFNMERFLDRSVNSLLANEYSAKEIILVDDGSTDSTPEMCDRLAKTYPEIRCIHQANSGVSAARNVGIEAAQGEYIMLVDPDDYVTTDFITKAVVKIIETQADLVLFGYSTPWFRVPPTWEDYYPIKDYQCKTQQEVLETVLPHFYGTSLESFYMWIYGDSKWDAEKELPSAWRFIYRKDFLVRNNLKFKPLKCGEDKIFCLECLSKANSLYSLTECLYKYEPLPSGTLAKSVSALEVLKTKLLILQEQHRIAKNLKQDVNYSALPLYAGSVLMGSLQIAFGICDSKPYKTWREFNRNICLSDSIDCMPVIYRGGKAIIAGSIA